MIGEGDENKITSHSFLLTAWFNGPSTIDSYPSIAWLSGYLLKWVCVLEAVHIGESFAGYSYSDSSMRNFLLILSLSLAWCLPVHAQSSAEQTTPGYLATSGCPGGAHNCFMPYSAVNPLPVSASASSILCPSCVDGDLLIGDSTGGGKFDLNTLTSGSGITITNGHGTITIASTGGGGTVTSLPDTSANGVSYTVANRTTTPTLTFTLGAITPTTVNGLTITTTNGTATIASGKTFTLSNSLTFTGTDGSSINFGTGGTVLYSGATSGVNLGTSVTAANPQISGDATTGLYTPSAGSVAVTISGTESILWNSGGETILTNGTASKSPLLLNGTILTGGSGTTNFPTVFLQPTGTTAATTWNTSGTGLGENLATGFAGLFLDFHKGGGSSLFSVDSSGQYGGAASSFVGAGSAFYWNGRSLIRSPSDGVIKLSNQAEGGFTRLQLGGTTSSFGALQTNGTETDSELADGSAMAAFGASTFKATGAVPTLANGTGALAASVTAGGILIGQGSTSDLTIENKSSASVCAVATGTTTLNCTGLQVGGVNVLTSGTTTGIALGTSVSATNPQIAADATTGLYTPGAAQVAVSISGVQGVLWNSTGEAITGTLSVKSSSATAFSVGPNGATNSALSVNASGASSATGVQVVSAAAGSGVTVTATSSGAAENLTLTSLGSSTLNLNGGTNAILQVANNNRVVVSSTSMAMTNWSVSATAASPRFSWVGAADSSLTASTEAPSIYWNLGQTRTHAAGTIALQRDYRITCTDHAFASASTLTIDGCLSIDLSTGASANATIPTIADIYIPSVALTGTKTASYNIYAAANTGATANYAAALLGAVGIGTANPKSELDVFGNVAIGTYAGSNAAPSNGLIVSGAVGIGTTTVGSPLTVGTSGQFTVSSSGVIAGVGTNITGTASGLTSGNVTTNANLTGPITSSGNATSIAAQTGTGSTFVVQTSPSLTTPNLNVAIGTSLALGGATIGSNALAVTGTAILSSNVTIGTTVATDAVDIKTSPPSAGGAGLSISDGTRKMSFDQTGATYSYHGVGANQNEFYISGNSLYFLADGQAINFITGASSTVALGISTAGAVTMPLIASSSAAQTGTVCWTTSTGNLTVDTTTTCLLSSLRYKKDIKPIGESLSKVMAIKPITFVYKDKAMGTDRLSGVIAEDVYSIDKTLVELDETNKPYKVRYEGLTVLNTKAIQELSKKVDAKNGGEFNFRKCVSWLPLLCAVD